MRGVVQTEASECGLACLAMVAAHHGLEIGMPEMRRRFPMSLKGLRLSQLIDIAGKLGLHGRALRLELEGLSRLDTPAILHWDLNHFVVLESVRRDSVVVLDPALGRRTLPIAEVSRHFTGVALELEPGQEFTPDARREAVSLRKLTGPVRGFWRALALLLTLSLALQVFVLATPFYMQWVVDQVLVSADASLLTVLGIGFAMLVVIQVAVSVLRGWTVVYLSARFGLQWMANVFAHLLRLPLDYFEKRHLGDIVSRIGSVQRIQQTITTNFVEAVVDGLMALATLAMMLAYSPSLVMVTLVAVVLYLGLRMATFRRFRDGSEQQLVEAARQQSHFFETARGMQTIKVSGIEGQRRSSYLNLLRRTIDREVWLARVDLVFSQSNALIVGLERVAVIWIGASFALDGTFTVGMLIAYLAYKEQFTQRVAALIDRAMEFRMLRLHGERLADIVMTEPEPVEQATEPLAKPPLIQARSLSFRYADGEPWVIANCDLDIGHGESVAIAGPSGCGKSTLVKLLLGLLTPVAGEIRIDGVPLKHLGPANFRRSAGVVMQDDQLFAGSIGENISLFGDAWDQARIEEAARRAAVHDDIVAMPMGYQTLIGDMGSSLSGGQRQRILMARALYRRPMLLILDEATSHLDVERERLVNTAVGALELTRIIVAHRPETIASADRVLLMEGGRIVRDYRPSKQDTAPKEAAERMD
ncbi:MAG: peptidase domain-containing ABC transporter [Xanthomonadales bacterium]|nr:peptidase domain-containing ABC transporter [Xanthomonadales bacterium]